MKGENTVSSVYNATRTYFSKVGGREKDVLRNDGSQSKFVLRRRIIYIIMSILAHLMLRSYIVVI